MESIYIIVRKITGHRKREAPDNEKHHLGLLLKRIGPKYADKRLSSKLYHLCPENQGFFMMNDPIL